MAYVLFTNENKTFVIGKSFACTSDELPRELCKLSHVPEYQYKKHVLFDTEQTALAVAQHCGDLTGIYDNYAG